jgi:site-specific DNA-methyltransferase (adenine-specific)
MARIQGRKLLPPQKSYSKKSKNEREYNFVQESIFDVDSKA